MSNETTALSDAELIELDALLAAPNFDGNAMSVVELHGLFSALVSGPEEVERDKWQPFALGEDSKFASPEQQARIEELLTRYFDDTRRAFEAGDPRLILADATDEELAESYGAWAGAYLDGMELSDEEWFAHVADDEEGQFLADALWPIDVLSGLAQEEAEEDGLQWPPEGVTEEEVVTDARETLPESALALYRFWLAKRGPGTVQREAPKVGRNDACPCGSGKKFKQCCGAEG